MHFCRSHNATSYRATILTPDTHPLWPSLFATSSHFRYHADLLAWEIDAEAEGAFWWIVADTIGLRSVCVRCLAGSCREARLTIDMREALARVQAALRAQAETRQRTGPLSTSREVGRQRNAERRARTLPTPECAAEILGIDWPTTRPCVQRAFQQAALAAHPDQGGSDAEMMRVLGAREALLELL